MKVETEGDLRQALVQYAETTVTSPYAWEQTLDRVDRNRGRRRIRLAIVSLAAATAVIAAALVWVGQPEHEQSVNFQLVAAMDATHSQERFAFSVRHDATPPGSSEPPVEGQYDTRRGVGWARTEPLPEEFRIPGFPEFPPVAAGADAVFDRQHVFLRSELVSAAIGAPVATPWVRFDPGEPGGHFGGIAHHVGRYHLDSVINGVRNPDWFTWLRDLPRNSTLVTEGTEDIRGVPTTRYRVYQDPALLERSEREGLGIKTSRVWIDPEGALRRVSIHNTPGTVDAEAEPSAQFETTDTVEFYAFGSPLEHDVPPASETTDGSALELPADFDFYGPLPQPNDGSPVADPSFFSLRPVIRLVPAPCTPGQTDTTAVLREVSADIPGDGCVEVGSPALDASAVTAAEASGEPGREWDVAYTLTPDGEAAFNAMAKQLGVGQQVAIVIDGVVVSALPLETEQFQVRGHLTGHFDEQTARQLADRLDPP